MNFKPLKYFSLKDSYEENKKMFRILVNQYHPDKPTGNEDMMKEINLEWEKVNEYFEHGKKQYCQHEICECDDDETDDNNDDLFEQEEKLYVTFKGIEYNLCDEDILRKIAIKHGGLGLMEFQMSDEWQEYINNYRI